MHRQRWTRRAAAQSARMLPVAIALLHLTTCTARRAAIRNRRQEPAPSSGAKNRASLYARNIEDATSVYGGADRGLVSSARAAVAPTIQTTRARALRGPSSTMKAPLRACQKCVHRAAAFGVTVGEGSAESERRWATILCRVCVAGAANASAGDNPSKVLRLAGRCAECNKFAVFGLRNGTRQHCR